MTLIKTRYANVYKDSKTGKFLYQVFLGRDALGRSRFKKGRRNQLRKPFKSAREAYQEAQRIKQEYLNIDLDNISYSYFMKEKFLPKYRGDVEETTYETHKIMFLKGIDYFEDMLLKKITVAECEKYRTWLLTDSGYSQSYASLVYTAFRQSLDYAVEIKLIPSNPALETKPIPKGRAVAKYWTKVEFEKVLSCISTDSFYEQLIYVTFLFFYRMGCRVSEGSALTWRNVDLVNGKVSFIQNVHYKNKMDYTISPYLKNDASRRTVSLDNELLQVLKDWKKLQEKYNVKNFVLSYDDTPLNKSTLSRWLKKYAQFAGVPRINGRGLRHSNASYLIAELGADVLTVSHRLGHKTPMTTLKYYAHMFSDNDLVIASKMENSMSIQPAEKSEVEFNGNQYLGDGKIVGMPKVCQSKKKTA